MLQLLLLALLFPLLLMLLPLRVLLLLRQRGRLRPRRLLRPLVRLVTAALSWCLRQRLDDVASHLAAIELMCTCSYNSGLLFKVKGVVGPSFTTHNSRSLLIQCNRHPTTASALHLESALHLKGHAKLAHEPHVHGLRYRAVQG